MRCGEKVLMDLYDFINRVDIDDTYMYFTAAGVDENGRKLYTFYFRPAYVDDEYSHEFYKATLPLEIVQMQLWQRDGDSGYYYPAENFSMDDHINKATGVGDVSIEDHLYFPEGSSGKKGKTVELESYEVFLCTVMNNMVELEQITKAEYRETVGKYICYMALAYHGLLD